MNNNKLKYRMLQEIGLALQTVSSKMNILDALDQDISCSGCHDLHDQLYTMTSSLDALKKATQRAELIVPIN